MSSTKVQPDTGPVSSFVDLATSLPNSGVTKLDALRAEGLSRFRELGFPHRKVEEWRETSLKPVFEPEYALAPGDVAVDQARGVLLASSYADLGLPRAVFVNGRFRAELSSDLPEIDGLYVGALSELPESWSAPVLDALGEVVDWRPFHFGALNAALAADVAVVAARAGTHVETPLQIVHLTVTAGEAPVITAPRTLVVAENGADLTLVETYAGSQDARYLVVPATEIRLGEEAHLVATRLQVDAPGSFHVGVQTSDQGARSNLLSRNVALGGKLGRCDFSSRLSGERAHVELDGLTMPRGTQVLDNRTTIDHAVPRCTSGEIYKGVLTDKGRSVFTGRIVVRQDSQETDARQQNDNLVLSPDALAQTRPQLEIYADDVKCAHGATIGRLDAEALFYLRTRGVPLAQARGMLIRAFAASVLDSLAIAGLRERLEDEIGARLFDDDEEGSR
jgi:Fe-S cluster assembly protein SufD